MEDTWKTIFVSGGEGMMLAPRWGYLYSLVAIAGLLAIASITLCNYFTNIEVEVITDDSNKSSAISVYRSSLRGKFYTLLKEGEDKWRLDKDMARSLYLGANFSEVGHKTISVRIGEKETSYLISTILKSWQVVDTPIGKLYQYPSNGYFVNFKPQLIIAEGWLICFLLSLAWLVLTYIVFRSKSLFSWVAVVLALFSLIFLCRDVFWMDSIDLVYILQNKAQGSLNLGDFWRVHNEHRIFTSKFVFYLLSYIAPFKIWTLNIVGQMAILIGVLFLVKSYPKEVSPAGKNFFTLTAFLLAFSLIHIENLLMSFHIMWHFYFMGFSILVYSLTKQRYLLNLFFLSSSIFLYLTLPFWVVIVPLVVCFYLYRAYLDKTIVLNFKDYISCGALLAVSAFAYCFYFADVPSVERVSVVELLMNYFLPLVASFFAILGNQILIKPVAIILGVIVLFAFIYAIYCRLKRVGFVMHEVHVLLGMLSIFSAALVAMGRTSSVGTVILSRYAIISTPIWISVISLCWLNYKHLFLKPSLVKFALFFLFFIQMIGGLTLGRIYMQRFDWDRIVVERSIEMNDPDVLKSATIYPSLITSGSAREHVLKTYKWLVDNKRWLPSKKDN